MKLAIIKKRTYSMILSLLLVLTALSVPAHAKDYSDYSNEAVAFGLNLTDDHTKPSCDKPAGITLSDYNTFYYNKKAYENKDKVIYLTFDCGYENGNTPKILDTLKEANVKAVFFITEPYVKEHKDLVIRMKEEGHLVGNHTCTHPRLPEKSPKEIQKEMNQCKATMEKLTGYTMDPFMRPPEGVYSVRVMKVLQDLGYNTMLWSLAIYDYEENDQPGADYVIDMFNKHHFPGMMPLLHVISSSDAEALPDIITSLEAKGYRFGMVTDFLSEDETAAASEEKDKKEETSILPRKKLNKEKFRKLTEQILIQAVTESLKIFQSPKG